MPFAADMQRRAFVVPAAVVQVLTDQLVRGVILISEAPAEPKVRETVSGERAPGNQQ